MRYSYKFLLILLLLLGALPIISFSQDCFEYHIENCRWAPENEFQMSRQSRSSEFAPGEKIEFSIVVYEGEEYYISVNGHRKLGDIRLRIYEDDEERYLLYDNKEYRYEKFFYFKVTNTRNLILEISSEENKDDKKYCLGVLIEYIENPSADR